MEKIFVIVWHVFMGPHAGDPTQVLLHAFSTEEVCRASIAKAMGDYDRDRLVHRNFYVDCMNIKDVPNGLPSV